MAVFRIEKTRDYTVMANHHLRNTKLSLKAKGLLSLMLSLPEDWDYTTRGLAKICKDGVDSICSAVNELEEHGYVIRERTRNAKGQLTDIQYTILEQPKPPLSEQGKPKQENPVLENPILEKPEQENPAQLNTKKSSKQTSKKDLSNTEVSNPIQSNPLEGEPQAADGIGTDTRSAREIYREIILENIESAIPPSRGSAPPYPTGAVPGRSPEPTGSRSFSSGRRQRVSGWNGTHPTQLASGRTPPPTGAGSRWSRSCSSFGKSHCPTGTHPGFVRPLPFPCRRQGA